MLPVGTSLFLKKLPRATLTIIGINFIVMVVEAIIPEGLLIWVIQHFGYGAGNWWNPLALITSMFLHADILHFVFNMLFLWIFGGPVEERIGRKNFLIFYMGGGIVSGVLFAVTQAIGRPGEVVPAIGASGAVSCIMAIYVYRCFYSKIKMVVDPLFLPIKVNIPAAPLIIFWFLQDLLGGISTFSSSSGVAYWGHIGGFVFGIVVARIKRYGHEGRIENLRQKIINKLEAGGGWSVAERELLKLLEIAPKDAEVNHDLARLYANRKVEAKARRYYIEAVGQYFISNPLTGAFTVLEYENLLAKPMGLNYLVRAAETFAEGRYLEEAFKVLSPITRDKFPKGLILERALALYIKLCFALGWTEERRRAIKLFNAQFRKSKYIPELKKALSKAPEEVFPPKPAVDLSRTEKRDDEEEESRGLVAIAYGLNVMTDPFFIFAWIIISIGASAFYFLGLMPRFLSHNFFSLSTQLAIFIVTLLLTLDHRMKLISRLWEGGPSEKVVRRELDLKRAFDDALMAERGDMLTDAARLYEELLKAQPDNVQARFNLSRLYHKKLEDIAAAVRHYKELIRIMNPEHPFYFEAKDNLTELLSKNRP